MSLALQQSLAGADAPKSNGSEPRNERGESARAQHFPTPLDGAGEHLHAAFSGMNLVLHGSAVASTVAMAGSGVDHSFRVAIRHQFPAPALDTAAYYGGVGLPVAVASGLYVTGILWGDSELAGAGSAAVQALAVSFTVTVFLKVATGRTFPRHGDDPRAPDQLEHPERAREFAPFTFDGHWAWPSGHTSASVAVVAALSGYWPHNIVVPLVGYPLALTIGVGMIAGDHHWASDVVAGALLGHAIGWSVGSGFGRRVHAKTAAEREWTVVPLLGEARGFALAGTF